MKLYWGPHTCAIGIHILLEEIGEPYETEKVDPAGGQTRQPPFMAVNPKGKVPTLVRDDGSVLTEFSAIATWLARAAPPTSPVTCSRLRMLHCSMPSDGLRRGTSRCRSMLPRILNEC